MVSSETACWAKAKAAVNALRDEGRGEAPELGVAGDGGSLPEPPGAAAEEVDAGVFGEGILGVFERVEVAETFSDSEPKDAYG